FQLFASASYLARAGTPRGVGELPAHQCVNFRGAPWPGNERGNKRRMTLVPRVESDEMFFVRASIRAGIGIGGMPTFLVGDDLAAGTLVRVLPRWSHDIGSVYLVHPARKHVPRRVTAFQELAVEALRHSPLGAR
ncbi:MAG TPA: LysR substrate-binding domain-containing protein, partial [Polyangiales bacterium]|nr:LysR substrate-binding domain-containing protein [Polyangiales bacterium]